jgi:hypothetical protein
MQVIYLLIFLTGGFLRLGSDLVEFVEIFGDDRENHGAD